MSRAKCILNQLPPIDCLSLLIFLTAPTPFHSAHENIKYTKRIVTGVQKLSLFTNTSGTGDSIKYSYWTPTNQYTKVNATRDNNCVLFKISDVLKHRSTITIRHAKDQIISLRSPTKTLSIAIDGYRMFLAQAAVRHRMVT